MGFMANLKGNKAYKLHAAKNYPEARKLYEEAFAEGMDNPRNILAYIALLIRVGDYKTARDVIVKVQKWPGFVGEQKTQLFCNYAAAVCRLGEVDKGVAVLERQAAKAPTGLVYQTLGYLYVVQLEKQPSKDEPAPIPEKVIEPHDENDEEDADKEEEDEEPEIILTPYEQWEQNVEKAMKLLQAAVEYDDEDPICMDNLAQFYYRVLKDKEKARPWFDKALALKDSQIDTLWFLAKYDQEEGKTGEAMKKLKKAYEGNFSALNYVNKELVANEIRALGGNVDDED